MSAVAADQGQRAVRVPPCDLDAETSVLGALLLDRDAVAKALEVVAADDFYRENNGVIFRAATALFHEGEPVDNVTLAAELAKLGVLERVGGRAHLAMLQEAVPTAANVEHYARIVARKALKRRLIAASARGMALGYDEGVEAEEALDQAQAQLFALSELRDGSSLVHVGELVRPAIDRLDAQIANGGGPTGVSTGFTDLDRMTNGFGPGVLAVIAGRPSMGKSSLVTQMAVHAAIVQHVPAAVFSLEMSKEQLVERMLCERAAVDAQRLHRGVLGDAEYDRLIAAVGPLADAPLWIDDSSAVDELSLRLKLRRAVARYGIRLAVVDYLQLMRGRSHNGDGNRVQEVSAIARALQSIARELAIPIIAVSQLSRAPESRPDKRPILSDLRESGEIEQVADIVGFVFRDDYYNKEKSEKPGIAEVIVAKHRNGPTGTIELFFRRECTRFESIDRRRGLAGGGGDE